ncbi:ribonuclease [Mycolicibacterium goodii]|uniref:Ribonuclease n=2 Tax=Mycolicibacterium goodii TaxID=134601 RepID=A0ABS6HUT7_MYCGD|nr:ribonuclease [Mycolicibacterium goodii]MBU8833575.1 ribonuclease [Mycolicibacterium goodii]MBU8839593.1 ribonuclease [Mycolicibacterium goodii]
MRRIWWTCARPVLAPALMFALVVGCAPAPEIEANDGSCSLASLPPEVSDTVELIESGGPFPYPRNDGVVFGNFEGLLPEHERGYYREYTVPTPGLQHRGARRIVTGGTPLDDPPEMYYTGDHYESFCLIGGA